MATDPRTPVIVGVGQSILRPDPDLAVSERSEPAVLMAEALRTAADDSGGGTQLLARTDSLRVVATMTWRYQNPALLVAEQLGMEPAEYLYTATGGNSPMSLLSASARAIQAGEFDVVAVVGAEAGYSMAQARRDPAHPVLPWTSQSTDSTPAPVPFGSDRAPVTDFENSRGLLLPIHIYPLFENALRGAGGWSLDEHRALIGQIGASFSAVAATNPYAWLPTVHSAAEIVTPGPTNRMISFPYTKLCTANMQVDQGAGFIMCSYEAARAAGVSTDQMVFPHAVAQAHDHWFLSHRLALHESVAIARCARAVFDLAGVGVDDIGPIDLYSCFPCVVQMAANAIGLDVNDDGRPLTLTGGLTFGGGPGNNYVSHSIAGAVEALRRDGSAPALVTGLGWYATKHAVGIIGSEPPAEGFRGVDVQDDVDATPQSRCDPEATGPVTIETYTVIYNREDKPERAIVACRTPDDARTWATSTDPGLLEVLVSEEGIGRGGRVRPEGVFEFS